MVGVGAFKKTLKISAKPNYKLTKPNRAHNLSGALPASVLAYYIQLPRTSIRGHPICSSIVWGPNIYVILIPPPTKPYGILVL